MFQGILCEWSMPPIQCVYCVVRPGQVRVMLTNSQWSGGNYANTKYRRPSFGTPGEALFTCNIQGF